MQMAKYTVRFITPAFLGDAEQKGAWRAPPFKALMRQWWRVLVAKEYGYDHNRLREAEGKLFGHAWLKNEGGKSWAMRSQVLIRLSSWQKGTLNKWPTQDPRIVHPEVDRPPKIGAHLYLGFGALDYQNGSTVLAQDRRPVINESETMAVSIGYPESKGDEVRETVQLMHWFGTLGGRSRNGWGSFSVQGQGIEGFEALSSSHPLIRKLARPLSDCLGADCECPHAIGADDEGTCLVWRTQGYFSNWSELMKILAETKISYRSKLLFSRNKDAQDPRIDKRHVLAFPVTNHGVKEWCEFDERKGPILDRRGRLKPTQRLANQLRFKVAWTEQGYFGIIYHLPCRLPKRLLDAIKSTEDKCWLRSNEMETWKEVHTCLDENPSFERL